MENNKNQKFDDESTVIDEKKQSVTNEQTDVEQDDNQTESKDKKMAFSKASVVAGAGVGVLLGSISTFLTSCAVEAAPLDSEESSETDHPAWADESMQVSSSVDEDMSFSEAFSAARTELGPGAAFEWHGQVYGTYTAEEWDAMTPEQQHDFQNHFAWSSASDTTDHTQHETVVDETVVDETDVVPETDGDGSTDETDGAVDVVPEEDPNIIDSSQVEIIGVVDDGESGATGYMNIDGQEVVLVDTDGDGVFNVMQTDIDHDGSISVEEQADVSGANIHVSDFESNSIGNDSMYAVDDDTIPDYVNDADVSDYDANV